MKLLLIIAAASFLAGCTITVSPDGSRTYKPDQSSFLKAVKIIAEK